MLSGMETHTSFKHRKTLLNSCSAYCALVILISQGQRLQQAIPDIWQSHITAGYGWKEGWMDGQIGRLDMTKKYSYKKKELQSYWQAALFGIYHSFIIHGICTTLCSTIVVVKNCIRGYTGTNAWWFSNHHSGYMESIYIL